MSSKKLLGILLAVAFIMGIVGNAHAFSSYMTAFNSTYGTSFTCDVCHVNPKGGGTRNAYGNAFAAVPTHSSNPTGAFATIGSQASACSGYTYLQLINLGINPGPGSCPTPSTTACTGYTYSAWSACGSNGQQTRTVTGNLPAGCAGTPSAASVLTQACTYVPPTTACTGYTYSAWSACGSNGQQTRTVTGNLPAGCTGTPSAASVLTQSCTPSSLSACTYTYSAWSQCKPNNKQTRKVVSRSPARCTGRPDLVAVCNYVPPAPPPPPPAADGTTLYMQHCSACHGSIEKSQVRGESAADITEAIADVSQMQFLSFLSAADIQTIANALVTTTPPPTPPVPAGGVHPNGWIKQHPDFVERNGTSTCKTCHGQDLRGGTGPSCYSCHKNDD